MHLQSNLRRLSAALAALALLACTAHALAGDEFLDPDVAFKYSARAVDRNNLEIKFRIAKGYYLYRERFDFKLEPETAKLGKPQFPRGAKHKDEFFGEVETYRGDMVILLPVAAGSTPSVKLKTTYQGCADAGFCYPPQERTSVFSLVAAKGGGLGGSTQRHPLSTRFWMLRMLACGFHSAMGLSLGCGAQLSSCTSAFRMYN